MTFGASTYGGAPYAADTPAAVIGGVTGAGAGSIGLEASGIAFYSVSGAGSAVLALVATGTATYTSLLVAGSGIGVIDFTVAGQASHGVAGTGTFSLGVTLAGFASHGVQGAGCAALPLTATADSKHGVSGLASGTITLTSAGAAIHERYELRGEVREGGVLVNRRVRAYLRSTGALLGQADTVVGKFSVNTGFSKAECYITPIDLGEFASDWLPPTANRIVPVLAFDTV